MHDVNRIVSTAVVVAVLGVLLAAASRGSNTEIQAGEPIVTVIRQGGLCYPGAECRTTLRIGDATISGEGYRPRRLTPGERRALLRAIGKLDVAYLRAHPFTGLCPTAYDGPETTYRFRGFPRRLPGCTYDLRGVEAVRLTEKLLTSLRPAR
jgi:hypothetical protein